MLYRIGLILLASAAAQLAWFVFGVWGASPNLIIVIYGATVVLGSLAIAILLILESRSRSS